MGEEPEPAQDHLAIVACHTASGRSRQRSPSSSTPDCCIGLVARLRLREYRFGWLSVAADVGASAVDGGMLVCIKSYAR